MKVLDFGLAKLTLTGGANAPMTRTGEVFGSPMYMPPEQLKSARDVDERTDVYAMGAVLHQALTGSTPYKAKSFAELVIKIVANPPESLETARPGITPALAKVIEHAMRRERDERIQSVQELRDALSACLGA